MPDFEIPQPEGASSEPSELTKLEISAMKTAQRNNFLYERSIEDLNAHIISLKDALKVEREENKRLNERCGDLVIVRRDNSVLKRAKVEMFVCFLFATLAMAAGGGLISSYPVAGESVPWQFSLGWCLIILSAVFGVFSRLVVWLFFYIFPEGKQRAPAS